MNIILFDDAARLQLLPFTHTRPVADIRCGILTARARWEKFFPAATTLTETYLQEVWPLQVAEENLLINGAAIANDRLTEAIHNLQPNQKLVSGERVIAARLNEADTQNVRAITAGNFYGLEPVTYTEEAALLSNVWDIFSFNDAVLRSDFALLTNGRQSAPIPEGVIAINRENIFIEEGAFISPGTVLNAQTGSIYIGPRTEIMEGCLLRGPLALCEGAVIKMGAKIYGATTLGPECRAGGELSNVVMMGYSNKGHDGFLGNAVIGEWCNLGADTNCSNLKNDYGKVKIWSEHLNRSVHTGLTFCGLIMGDHSKCSINTMFNTGTVVGVSCNIFGTGFPDRFVPSFTWGGSEGTTTYQINKAADTAIRMMERRHKTLSAAERRVLEHVFEHTSQQRTSRQQIS